MNKIYTVKYKLDGKVITSNDRENDVYSLNINEEGNRYTEASGISSVM